MSPSGLDSDEATNSPFRFDFELVSLPVPEPATYGVIGVLTLLGLVTFARIRNTTAELGP